MEKGYDDYTKKNVYDGIPPSKPIRVDHAPGETMPMIPRIESDSPADSSEPQPTMAPPTFSPPVTPQAAAVNLAPPEAKKSVYCELHLRSNPVIPAPPLDSEPQYDTVNQFQNPQVHA